jgi:hypothetical protein
MEHLCFRESQFEMLGHFRDNFHQDNALWRNAGPDKAMRDRPCPGTKLKHRSVRAFVDMLGDQLAQYWRGRDDGTHLQGILQPPAEKQIRGARAYELI